MPSEGSTVIDYDSYHSVVFGDSAASGLDDWAMVIMLHVTSMLSGTKSSVIAFCSMAGFYWHTYFR